MLDFGLSWLTSLQFIQYPVAGFYKPSIPQSPSSHLRDYSTCNNAKFEFFTIFVPSFDPNEWCLKNGLHSLNSGGLNPGPQGHESSALTTRPRLLALVRHFFFFFFEGISLPYFYPYPSPSPFGAATYFLGRTLMLSQSPFRYTLFKQLLLD